MVSEKVINNPLEKRNIHLIDFLLIIKGRNSINRTPDALTSMDCNDDALFPNQAGRQNKKKRFKIPSAKYFPLEINKQELIVV